MIVRFKPDYFPAARTLYRHLAGATAKMQGLAPLSEYSQASHETFPSLQYLSDKEVTMASVGPRFSLVGEETRAKSCASWTWAAQSDAEAWFDVAENDSYQARCVRTRGRYGLVTWASLKTVMDSGEVSSPIKRGMAGRDGTGP